MPLLQSQYTCFPTNLYYNFATKWIIKCKHINLLNFMSALIFQVSLPIKFWGKNVTIINYQLKSMNLEVFGWLYDMPQ